MPTAADPSHWVLEAVETYELPLLRYARRLLDDLDLAHDAVQHAFVKLCEQSQEKLEGRVAPWLFRVCRNKVIDHLRQAGRERTLLDDGTDSTPSAMPALTADSREANPADLAEQHDLADLVAGLLAHLPASQRETLDLWCTGLSHRQIAEVTGRTEANVRVLTHRGLTTLRTHPHIQRLLADRPDHQPARLP